MPPVLPIRRLLQHPCTSQGAAQSFVDALTIAPVRPDRLRSDAPAATREAAPLAPSHPTGKSGLGGRLPAIRVSSMHTCIACA